jgi:hypothetical protein
VSSSEIARLFEQLAHFVQPQIENVVHLRRAQRTIDHDVVDAVQELGPEVLAHTRITSFLRLFEVVLGLEQSPWSRFAPRFEVMMSTVFLKSTVRPLESVRRPSSITCKRTLKTSGAPFRSRRRG